MGLDDRDEADTRLTAAEVVLMAGALALIGVLLLMVAAAI